MSIYDKINAIIDNIDPGRPEFKVNVRKDYISIRPYDWNSGIESGAGFYETLVKHNIRREFSSDSKKWAIDRQHVINEIKGHIVRSASEIFQSCSPAKEPRRTKIYKSFRTILKDNSSKIDFINAMADIAEYYYSVTRTDSIEKSINDVHRKNIYQLLCLMEKRYAKRKENSNG